MSSSTPASARRASPGATRSGPSPRGVPRFPNRLSKEVAAPTSNSEKTLAWEARQRKPAGVAAIIGAIGLLFYFVLGQIIARDTPTAASGLEALTRAGQPGDVYALPS